MSPEVREVQFGQQFNKTSDHFADFRAHLRRVEYVGRPIEIDDSALVSRHDMELMRLANRYSEFMDDDEKSDQFFDLIEAFEAASDTSNHAYRNSHQMPWSYLAFLELITDHYAENQDGDIVHKIMRTNHILPALEYIEAHIDSIDIQKQRDYIVAATKTTSDSELMILADKLAPRKKEREPIIDLAKIDAGLELPDAELALQEIVTNAFAMSTYMRLFLVRRDTVLPDISYEDIAQKMLGTELGKRALRDIIYYFKDLHEDVAMYISDCCRSVLQLAGMARPFNGFSKAFIENVILPQGSAEGALVTTVLAEFEKHPGNKIPEELVIAKELYGLELDWKGYHDVKALISGEIPDDYKRIGITRSGQAGLNDLRLRLTELVAGVVKNDRLPALDELEGSVVGAALTDFFRLHRSQWGQTGITELYRVAYHYKEENAKLHKAYKPGLLRVEKTEWSAEYTIPKDAQDEYNRYVSEIMAIGPRSGRTSIREYAWNNLLGAASRRADQLTIAVALAKNRGSHDLADKLSQQKGILRAINLEDIDSFERALPVILRYKDMQSDARRLAFIEYRASEPANLELHEVLDSYEINIDNVAFLKEFIDHQVVQEYWGDILGKDAYKALAKIMTTDALQHAVTLHQRSIQGSGQTTQYDVVPSRGAFLELSGHLGDACWASNYFSIAKDFPNITGLAFMRSPGTKDQRPAGSALLVETTTHKEPLLIIRGLNPLTTDNNQMVQESFVSELIDYLRPVAKQMGRKLAIAIDGKVGGACTNRPPLFDYLNTHKSNLVKVENFKDESTRFNGYDLAGSVYLI